MDFYKFLSSKSYMPIIPNMSIVIIMSTTVNNLNLRVCLHEFNCGIIFLVMLHY